MAFSLFFSFLSFFLNNLTRQCLSPPDGDLRLLPKYVSHNCFHVQTPQEHVVNGCDTDVTIPLGLGSCMVDLANWIWGGEPFCLAARFHVHSLGRGLGSCRQRFLCRAWIAGHPLGWVLHPSRIPLHARVFLSSPEEGGSPWSTGFCPLWHY